MSALVSLASLALTFVLVAAYNWLYISPRTAGKVDGMWREPLHRGEFSGLRQRIYARAYRQHYGMPEDL